MNARAPVKTSVIVASRGRRESLIACLDAVFSQTLPFYEVIVTDGGRTEDAFQICRTLYPGRVRYEAAPGLSGLAAKNRGFSASSGNYLLFISACERLDASFHEKLIAPLLEDPALGFSYCGVKNILPSPAGRQQETAEGPLVPFDARKLWLENYIQDPYLMRREAWCGKDRAFGCAASDDRWGEAWDLLLETVKRGWEGRLVPERLVLSETSGESPVKRPDGNAVLLEEHKWTVRSRHLFYELTIIYLYSGKKPFRRALDFLGRMQKPQKTQVIFFNGSPASMPGAAAKKSAAHYEEIPRTGPIAPWKRECLERAKYYARGDKVLVLTDGNFFPDNVYFRLLKGMVTRRASFYSAASYRADSWERTMAWRAVRGNPGSGLYSVSAARGAKRVFAALFDGTLIDAKIFVSLPLSSEEGAELFPFCEAGAGAWAAERGLKWFIDGSVRSLSERPVYEGTFLPSVSIVIPVRNSRRAVVKLLRSIKRLDYPKDRVEILVVDNNSTDGTPDAVLAEGGAGLLYEKKRSSYAARNTGIRASRHSLIAFADADTRVTRSWLRDLVSAMLSRPGIGAVGGGSRSLAPRSFFSRLERQIHGYQNHPGSPHLLSYAITMNVLYRREVFEEAGLFDDTSISGSDIDMSFRMQRETSWELLVLEKKGMAGHEDVRALGQYIRRRMRIGNGFYYFHRKYPLRQMQAYYWLPQRRLELALQFLKSAVKREISTPAKERRRDRLRNWTFELGSFFDKWGYLSAMKEETASRPRARSRLVFFGSTPLYNDSPEFEWMREKAKTGTDVLRVDPPVSFGRTLLQLLTALSGGTTVWARLPGLKTLELWELFPGARPGGFLRRLNDRLNARRILRAAGARPEEHLLVSGSVSSPELIRRRTLLGRQRTEVLPACVIEDISLLQPPFASCILREVTGALDLGAYEAVARFSPWPVLVTGTLPSGMIPRLAGIASRTPNLYFLPEPADDELRKKITAMSGLMIYAFKDGVLQSPGLPEIFRQEGTEALPCTIACGISPEMPAGEPHPARVKTFSAAADLVRAARAYLSFPSWPPVRDFRYEREYLAALDVKN